MTKATYKQLNPGIFLVVAGENCSSMLEVKIYNDDGTPAAYHEPSDEAMVPIISKIMSAFEPGVDLRTVTLAFMMIEQLTQSAAQHSVQAIHQLMHESVTSHLDSKLMHAGLEGYMDGSTIVPSTDSPITPENVGEHVLNTFFYDSSKPN
jgi:hypothetical protein